MTDDLLDDEIYLNAKEHAFEDAFAMDLQHVKDNQDADKEL